MDFETAYTDFQRSAEAMKADFVNLARQGATDCVALIVNRIQQEGIPGRTYSENPLPVFWFEGKALNAGGRALLDAHHKKKERAKTIKEGGKVRKNAKLDNLENGISYGEWRRANGLQTNHIDLTFTNRMFRGLIIKTVENSGGVVSVVIAGQDQETIDKLQWNTDRFGYFLNLDPGEIIRMTIVQTKQFNELVKKHFSWHE